MGLYYDGYYEAREYLLKADLEDLLNTIDGLYGRDNLRYGATVEDVRQEALKQLKEEFTDRNSESYNLQQNIKLLQKRCR